MKYDLNIAIVVSRFNSPIVEPLTNAAMARLKEKGLDDEDITTFEVPGALEIPVVVAKIAPLFDVVICLGAVVRGETSHYDLVSESVTKALSEIPITYDIPVINGILTVENRVQAMERVDRGAYFADSAIEMGLLCQNIDEELMASLEDFPLFEEN